MADRLFLSYRLLGYTASNMVRHYEKMLRTFPFSKLSDAPRTLRVHAVSFVEPALYEESFAPDVSLDTIVPVIREYLAPDCAAVLESDWDLWQHDSDWQVTPARVELQCFGPAFETDSDDHLRVDFGPDAYFMPDPALPDSLFMAQSNIRSLLTLVERLDVELSVDRRLLWTESGDNFADRLAAVVKGEQPGPRLV
jgi:hypothetical protein